MKRVHKGLVFILVALPLSIAAESQLTNSEVRYTGDNVAQRVCKSVVNDDTSKLNKLLRNYRDTLVYRYRFTDSRGVSGDFACNNQALLDFANTIGAVNVSSYLRGGVVTMEELVSFAD
mgnify:CR=1 FL=1